MLHCSRDVCSCGHLSHIATTSRWLTHLLSHLYTSLASSLQVNKAFEISSNKSFRDALRALDQRDITSHQRTFHQGAVHRTIHKSKKTHFLNATAKEEIRLIKQALTSPTISLRTPIAHLVPCDSTADGYGDSSLDAAGGFSEYCRFWWYLEWSAEICSRTLCKLRDSKSGKFISIKVLEYASIIINFAAVSLYFRQHPDVSNPFPLALLFADNISAEVWAIKGCKCSFIGRALGRLLCALLINNPVGLSTDWVSTHDNKIADQISRLKSETDSLSFFISLIQSYPQLRGCRRFLPSHALLSGITEALLTGKLVDPLALSRIILSDPGKFTS